MKVNFTQVLHDLNGEPMKEQQGPDSPKATLGFICVEALHVQLPGEQIPEGQKFHRYQLAVRIKNALREGNEAIDVPAEDVALLKKQIGKGYGVSVVGPAFIMLESMGLKAVDQEA